MTDGELHQPEATEPGADVHASFGMRFGAFLIDYVGVTLVASALAAGFGLDGRSRPLSLLGIAYFVLLEGSPSGQTVGKKLMGIRVVDLATGAPIGLWRALGRHFARILSAVVLLLGYLWMLWDDESQTWHDKLVRAVVVRERSYPVSRWPGW